mmetsp:Transcript_49020/g.116632  ORF Transcript_49020/g.116632 Transcript_49020/m.116632 type:complete len:213 (-) Transcript_49020:1073-1711(-)
MYVQSLRSLRHLWLSASNIGQVSPAHHLHELLEIDLSIAIHIDLLHDLSHILGCCILDVTIRQHISNFLLADLAIAVSVKDAEGHPTYVFLDVGLLIQSGRQELRVINDSTSIGIHVLHDLLHVWRNILQARLLHAFLHLIDCEQTIAVAIQGHEHLSQLLDLVLIQVVRDDVQSSLFQLVHGSETAQVVHEIGLQVDICCLGRLVFDPLVV